MKQIETQRTHELEQRIIFYQKQLDQARNDAVALELDFRNSTSWKLTAPIRAPKVLSRKLKRLVQVIPLAIQRSGGVLPATRKTIAIFRREGRQGVATRMRSLARKDPPITSLDHSVNRQSNELESDTSSETIAASNANLEVDVARIDNKLMRFFDAAWYRKHNLTMLSFGVDPLKHYIGRGNAMALAPHPWFDTARYYRQFDEAALTTTTALEHFLDRVDREAEIDKAPSRELRLALRDMLASRLNVGAKMERSPPQVTFIIPVYNDGAFLEDAVLSAFLSTSCPCEIIVVNDGSVDPHTLEEIQRIGDTYGVKIIHKENGGLSSARNAGVELATSRAVKFLDCDDLLWPKSTDIQLEQLRDNNYSAVSLGEYQFCGRDGGKWIGPDVSTIKPFPFSEESFFSNWEKGFSIPIHCALFPIELVHSHRFIETVRAKEDWLFWMEISGAGWESTYVSDMVALYRIHGSNMCSNSEAMGLEYLRAAIFHVTKDSGRVDHIIKHFSSSYLGNIKAAAIDQMSRDL